MTGVWIALGLALGALLGAAYFAALRWNVDLYLAPGRRAKAVALHVGRVAALAAALAGVAHLGAGALLAAAAGVLGARAVMTRPKPR